MERQQRSFQRVPLPGTDLPLTTYPSTHRHTQCCCRALPLRSADALQGTARPAPPQTPPPPPAPAPPPPPPGTAAARPRCGPPLWLRGRTYPAGSAEVLVRGWEAGPAGSRCTPASHPKHASFYMLPAFPPAVLPQCSLPWWGCRSASCPHHPPRVAGHVVRQGHPHVGPHRRHARHVLGRRHARGARVHRHCGAAAQRVHEQGRSTKGARTRGKRDGAHAGREPALRQLCLPAAAPAAPAAHLTPIGRRLAAGPPRTRTRRGRGRWPPGRSRRPGRGRRGRGRRSPSPPRAWGTSGCGWGASACELLLCGMLYCCHSGRRHKGLGLESVPSPAIRLAASPFAAGPAAVLTTAARPVARPAHRA